MKCSGPLHRRQGGGGHVHTQTQLLHQTLHSEHKLRLGGLCFLSGAVS